MKDRPEAVLASSVLAGVRDRHRRSTRLARHRVAGRGLSVERQVQDLAEGLVRVLRRRETLPFATTEEQRIAVRSEGNNGAELASGSSGRIVPQPLQAGQLRSVRA